MNIKGKAVSSVNLETVFPYFVLNTDITSRNSLASSAKCSASDAI